MANKLAIIYSVTHRVQGELILDGFDKGARFPKLSMKKKRELYTELSSVLRILVYVDTGNLSDEIKLQKGAEQEKKVKAICKKLGLNYGNFHKEAEKEWEGKVWR